MKISGEAKVAVTAIVIIVLFFWLFNFLKGHNLLRSTDQYHIIYSNIAGLEESSPVEINGLKAGIVTGIGLINDGRGLIHVTISIDNGYKIPVNSVAEITTATLIAGMKIDLKLDSATTFYSGGDTIPGRVAVSIIEKLEGNLEPISEGAATLITKIDTLVTRLNMLFTPDLITSIEATGSSVESASQELEMMLAENRKSLKELVNSMNQTAAILRDNRQEIDSSLKNLNYISSEIASAELSETVHRLNLAMEQTTTLLGQVNSGEGSAGKLVYDDSLYVKLTGSLEALELLLNDLKENPGRYVNVSVFGGKKRQ